MAVRLTHALVFVLTGLACVAPEPSQRPQPDASAAPAPSPCKPQGVSRAPGTIQEVVTLVNALPRPVTLECFLESLERPLRIAATTGAISLQPARGSRSPRMFLFSGKLISSVVPEGSGRALVEFGEFVDETRTVKGEIKFPIEGPLDAAEPYQRVLDESGRTVCRGCHRDEERAAGLALGPAFVSAALRPVPNSLVDLERMREEHLTCDAAAEPERCAFYAAIFNHGQLIGWAFPAALPTIFY